MDTTITTLEFCAGYGGIGLGLKNIFGERLRCLAYCELEGFAQANLISKMEKGLLDVAPLWNNLKTFPYGKFHGLVDILIAGYPCQPFSTAGKRAGKEDPRHLWPWIADGIRILRPRVCFFENVEGHISLGLREVVGELESLGYETTWGIFSASEVGAPHQRKRVFIMAHRTGAGFKALWDKSISERNEGFASESSELAHSADQRPEWSSIIRSPSASEAVERCGAWSWPSRPGEPQHGWEPPRVVGNTSSKRCEQDTSLRGKQQASWVGEECGTGDAEAMGNSESEQSSSRDHRGQQGSTCKQEQVQLGGGDCGALRESNGQTQPPLGGNPDGPADWLDYAELYTTCDNRTDELRLLGNGVVPATAERAFRTLLTELLTNKQP